MSKRRQTVDDWVKSVTIDVIDGKGCSAIALLHLKGVGGAVEEVTTKPLEGTVNPTELANHLIGRAEGFSQDLAGLQTFKLVAFYGSNEPHNPFHFTTSDGTVMSRSETMMSAHEPTPTGLLGQLMKHNESYMAMNNQLVTACMNMANTTINMCFGTEGVIQKSVGSQMEAIEIVKDAMLNMHKERKEILIAESQAAQNLQTRKAVIDAIPHLVNRFTGHEVFDEKTNDSKIIEALAMRISPDDLKLLVGMGKLTSEQALILSARFTSIIEEKKKEADLLKKVPSEESQPKTALAKGNGGL
jgi:hypothetical protein